LLLPYWSLSGCMAPRYGASAMISPPEGAALPVRVREGLLLVPVRMGADGVDHWCLLDTGTDRALFDANLCRKLGLAPRQSTSIVAATGAEVEAHELLPIQSLRVGPIEFRDVDAASIDLQQLRDHAKLPIEGILGCDLFRGSLLELDLSARSVYVRPMRNTPSEQPIRFDGRVPVVPAMLAGKPLEVLVDTGFQSLLAVPPEMALDWRFPPRTTGELATLDGIQDHGSGRALGTLTVGPLRFQDPWVMVAKGQPKIGMWALRRSKLTLDAAGGRIWIQTAP
jgi:predicted aspartyl protease